MEFSKAASIVADVPEPHIPAHRARALYQHIRTTRPGRLLELGTARGGSAVFIGAALEANGYGHLTSVDSPRWRWRDPTPQELLDDAGLAQWVTLDRSCSTYTWFLKRELESSIVAGSVRPKYDFTFLDGSKNWTTDGLAVLLAERLLRPGGWLLLDDMNWSYAEHAGDKPFHYEIEIAKLSEDERTQPHIRAVFDLLVRSNPAFDRVMVQGSWWGWARKAPSVSIAGRELSPRTVAALRRRLRLARQAVRALRPHGLDRPGRSKRGQAATGNRCRGMRAVRGGAVAGA